jgi:hypothetical protein
MDLEEVRALSPKLADLIGARESSLSLFRHLQFFVREPEKFGKLALVCGGIGFGKTAIVRAVCGRFVNFLPPRFFFSFCFFSNLVLIVCTRRFWIAPCCVRKRFLR